MDLRIFKACRDGKEDVHKATLTYESCVFAAAFGVTGLLGQVVGAAVAGASSPHCVAGSTVSEVRMNL